MWLSWCAAITASVCVIPLYAPRHRDWLHERDIAGCYLDASIVRPRFQVKVLGQGGHRSYECRAQAAGRTQRRCPRPRPSSFERAAGKKVGSYSPCSMRASRISSNSYGAHLRRLDFRRLRGGANSADKSAMNSWRCGASDRCRGRMTQCVAVARWRFAKSCVYQ
jgi:hypothetical protein